MPIYLIFFSYKMLPNGYMIKEIREVLETVFEKSQDEINKRHFEMGQYNLQCEYWARHDESILENAAKGVSNG